MLDQEVLQQHLIVVVVQEIQVEQAVVVQVLQDLLEQVD
jgi:hypothetical protein